MPYLGSDWRPLEQLARICRQHPKLPDLDPDDFMWMGNVGFGSAPDRLIQLYKHIFTRRDLNLDANGHAWAVEWRPDGDWSATAIRDLGSAIRGVQGVPGPEPPRLERPPLAL